MSLVLEIEKAELSIIVDNIRSARDGGDIPIDCPTLAEQIQEQREEGNICGVVALITDQEITDCTGFIDPSDCPDLATLVEDERQSGDICNVVALLTLQEINDCLTNLEKSQFNGVNTVQTNVSLSTYTGDDGYYAAGRLVDWQTLNLNNKWGNTNRFTDEDGLQVYSNSIVVDHAFGFMWRWSDSTFANWETSIDNCESATWIGYTDWKLPNVKEMMSIANYFFALFNMSPFPVIPQGEYWTSTSGRGSSSAEAFWISSSSTPAVDGLTRIRPKTGNRLYMCMRYDT